MKKVTHLVRWFLPFTASFIRNQIIYHQNYQPNLVYLQLEEGAFQEEIQSNFETFYPFDRNLDRMLYEKARLLTPSAKNKIKKYLKQHAPDVLHVHYGVDAILYASIIRDLGIPACVSFYGYDCTSFPKRFNGYGRKLLQSKVFQNPSVKAVLAMTEDMKRDLLHLGCPEEKVIVHYYGTETKPFFHEAARKENGVVNILIISGLHEKKGHKNLINAFAKAQEQTKKSMHLHIVGGGPLHNQIEAQIKNNSLKNISLHGPVKYGSDEHMTHIRKAHIFAHPSITPPNGDKEGIPGAIIEAMAAGLPVISTYHGGISYVLEHEKTGLLVKEHDQAGLTEAIVRLVSDTEQRNSIAQAGQAYALDFLDVQEKEKELESIYDALVRNQS